MRLSIRQTSLGMAFVLMCGCNKHNVLEAERSTLERQQRFVQEQIDAYDEKIRALNRLGNAFDAKAKAEATDPKVEIATAAANEKIKTWTAHEDRLKELSAKAEAYKARHLK